MPAEKPRFKCSWMNHCFKTWHNPASLWLRHLYNLNLHWFSYSVATVTYSRLMFLIHWLNISFIFHSEQQLAVLFSKYLQMLPQKAYETRCLQRSLCETIVTSIWLFLYCCHYINPYTAGGLPIESTYWFKKWVVFRWINHSVQSLHADYFWFSL